MSLRVSPRLAAIPHYEPGLTTAEVLRRYGLDAAVKITSNESPFPTLPQVAEVVAAGAEGLNRYPDAYARELRGRLAEQHGVEPTQVAIGNGSCELILLAGQATLDPGTTVVHADPSFAIYPHLATAAGAEAVAVPLADDDGHDLDAMAAEVDERTRLVVVCNPNNPTGVYRSADEIERFLDAIPEDLPVLIDEAYNDFVDEIDRGRVMSLAMRRPNLLVTRTFSKAYGLCGLRIGYGIGGEDWVRAIDQVRQPFNTSAIAQAAALAAIRARSAVQERIAQMQEERTRVQDALARMGVAFTPSQANFVLVGRDGDDVGSPSLHEDLLRRGVIVRDGRALGVPGRLRVTIGTASENDAFLDALRDATNGQTAEG